MRAPSIPRPCCGSGRLDYVRRHICWGPVTSGASCPPCRWRPTDLPSRPFACSWSSRSGCRPPSPRLLFELGWLVVLGTVVPFLLEVDALKLTDAGTVGVVATLEPVIAAVVAWIWLGQRLTISQVLGGVIVVAAIAVVQYFTGGEGEPTPIG